MTALGAARVSDVSYVSSAIESAKAERVRVGRQSPRLDAQIAVMTADLRDRSTGITGEGEITPGIEVARSITVSAAVAS